MLRAKVALEHERWEFLLIDKGHSQLFLRNTTLTLIKLSCILYILQVLINGISSKVKITFSCIVRKAQTILIGLYDSPKTILTIHNKLIKAQAITAVCPANLRATMESSRNAFNTQTLLNV